MPFQNFFLLFLVIWSPCHLSLVMLSLTLLKCQGHPSIGKFTFCCYFVHLLQTQRCLHKGMHIWMQLHKCFAPSSLRSLKLLTVPKRKTLQHWVWFEHIYGFYIEQILQSSYHIVNSKLVCRWDFGLWNRISQHRYSTRIQKYWF